MVEDKSIWQKVIAGTCIKNTRFTFMPFVWVCLFVFFNLLPVFDDLVGLPDGSVSTDTVKSLYLDHHDVESCISVKMDLNSETSFSKLRVLFIKYFFKVNIC